MNTKRTRTIRDLPKLTGAQIVLGLRLGHEMTVERTAPPTELDLLEARCEWLRMRDEAAYARAQKGM